MGKEPRNQNINEGFQPDQQKGYQPNLDINAGFQPDSTSDEGNNPPTMSDTIDSGENNK